MTHGRGTQNAYVGLKATRFLIDSPPRTARSLALAARITNASYSEDGVAYACTPPPSAPQRGPRPLPLPLLEPSGQRPWRRRPRRWPRKLSHGGKPPLRSRAWRRGKRENGRRMHRDERYKGQNSGRGQNGRKRSCGTAGVDFSVSWYVVDGSPLVARTGCLYHGEERG